MRITARIILSMLLLSLPAPALSCGLTSSQPKEPASGEPGYQSLPNYGDAIEDAQDAAGRADQRAREIEDEVRKQMEGAP